MWRARGYATRIGFEDTLTLPDGGVARGIGELVRVALARLTDPATVSSPEDS